MASRRVLDDNYFKLNHFEASENRIEVKISGYNKGTISETHVTDISDKIIDYSYECTYDNNIRQTASITIKTDPDNTILFTRRPDKQKIFYDSGGIFTSTTWYPLFYKLTIVYTNYDTDTVNRLNLGYFIPENGEYTYNPTSGTVTLNLIGLSALCLPEYGGNIYTDTVGITYEDPNNLGTFIEKEVPMTLSIAQGTSIDEDMIFYNLFATSTPKDFQKLWYHSGVVCPCNGVYIGQGRRLYELPYDVDFDLDVSRDDIIQKLIEIGFVDAHYWIDENLMFNVSSKTEIRTVPVALWGDYGELFLNESVNYDDSGHYNVTRVFGKDSEYFAECDESNLDYGQESRRVQTLSFDELQSNEECKERAKWENYKARITGLTVSVELVNRYIFNSYSQNAFFNPSNCVGNTIEYMSVDGDVGLYFLDKIAITNENISLTLSPFRVLYDNISSSAVKTLKMPEIYKHEIINNNIIRLYVTGDSINDGVVKLYTGGAVSPVFYCCSTHQYIDPEHPDNNIKDKYVDYPIDHNGIYEFTVSLYSPLQEDSGHSAVYSVEITDYKVPAQEEDPDPYPHPNIFESTGEHDPYIVTISNKHITAADGGHITV